MMIFLGCTDPGRITLFKSAIVYHQEENVKMDQLSFDIDRVPYSIFLYSLYNCTMELVCIYLLVGSRILFIMLSQKFIDHTNSNSNNKNEFSPLKLTNIGYIGIISIINKVRNYANLSMSNSNNLISEDKSKDIKGGIDSSK
ncbi:hypothetical protein PIROE2DRAFT_14007 [Piromyces sp. E2]|nr:hypothetical protein PIROE2DRAFT_14007 [Piromyces sp. E2]|eukprot:OUM60260.1 hypothetical protein PIROE2DRAFT_14007 [Piromyces sp. E2]